MSKCFKSNKYICLYIYICLLHFVINEDKYYLRFDGEPQMKWEFTLDLNTDGGLKLSNQLKEKEIEIEFSTQADDALECKYPLLNKQSSVGVLPIAPGNIIADNSENLYFVYEDMTNDAYGCQKIGQLINVEGFSGEKLKSLSNNINGNINLLLGYERIEQPKIAEINKKIIAIIIGGLIILIILLIIKLIVK